MLRLILEMDGEVVERADPHIGLLHRGTEKLIEYKTYMQAMPVFRPARLRVADVHGARLRAGGREAAADRGAGARRKWIRTLFGEITRILNHLLNVTTYALDVGAITPSLWGFEEREKLMEFYEAASRRAASRELFPAGRRGARTCRPGSRTASPRGRGTSRSSSTTSRRC